MRGGFALAAIEQCAAEAATRKCWMDEEGADLRRIGRGIQLARIAILVRVAAEQGTAPAPAATPGELSVGLDHEVRAVADELRVDAKGAVQRALDLPRRVVGWAELTRGQGYQRGDRGQVVVGGVRSVKSGIS